MKNKCKYMFMALAALVASGCEVSDLSEYSTLADVSWYLSVDTTITDTETMNHTINLEAGKHLAMLDLSQGYTSHQWIVPEDESIKFLEGAISSNNPSDEEYESMVVSKSYTTSDKSIFLWFTEEGSYEVVLYNVYPKQVYHDYYGGDATDWRDIRIYSEEIDGVHVWKETFTINAMNTEMSPTAKVYKDEALTEEIALGTVDAYTSVEIEIGDKLYFVDTTVGNPTGWVWTCPNLDEDMTVLSKDATITFNKTASADVPFNVWLETSRGVDTTTGTPAGTSVATVIPLDIIVKESTAPILTEIPVMIDDYTVEFALNNAQFSDDTTFATTDFTLSYSNIYGKTEAVTGDFTIASIEVKNSKVYLTTSDIIYNSDSLILKYVGADVDVENNSNDFTSSVEIPVAAPAASEPISYDFEDDSQIDAWVLVAAAAPATTLTMPEGALTIVDDPDGSENRCLMVNTETMYATTNPMLMHEESISLGAEKLTFKYTIRRASVSSATFAVRIYNDPYGTSDYKTWYGNNIQSLNTVNALTLDTWSTKQPSVTGTTSMSDLKYVLSLGVYTGILYLDNLIITNATARP